jgi:hypothetical protein
MHAGAGVFGIEVSPLLRQAAATPTNALILAIGLLFGGLVIAAVQASLRSHQQPHRPFIRRSSIPCAMYPHGASAWYPSIRGRFGIPPLKCSLLCASRWPRPFQPRTTTGLE